MGMFIIIHKPDYGMAHSEMIHYLLRSRGEGGIAE